MANDLTAAERAALWDRLRDVEDVSGAPTDMPGDDDVFASTVAADPQALLELFDADADQLFERRRAAQAAQIGLTAEQQVRVNAVDTSQNSPDSHIDDGICVMRAPPPTDDMTADDIALQQMMIEQLNDEAIAEACYEDVDTSAIDLTNALTCEMNRSERGVPCQMPLVQPRDRPTALVSEALRPAQRMLRTRLCDRQVPACDEPRTINLNISITIHPDGRVESSIDHVE
jgi:hypothetical protein